MDVIYYALAIANIYDIDIEQVIKIKSEMNEVWERFLFLHLNHILVSRIQDMVIKKRLLIILKTEN